MELRKQEVLMLTEKVECGSLFLCCVKILKVVVSMMKTIIEGNLFSSRSFDKYVSKLDY